MLFVNVKEENASLLHKLMKEFAYGFKTDLKKINLKEIIKDEAKKKYMNAEFKVIHFFDNNSEEKGTVEELQLKLYSTNEFSNVMATPLFEEDNVRFFYKEIYAYENNSNKMVLKRDDVEGYASVDFSSIQSYKGLKEAYIQAKKKFILQVLDTIFITDINEIKNPTNKKQIYISGIDINDVDFNKIPIV